MPGVNEDGSSSGAGGSGVGDGGGDDDSAADAAVTITIPEDEDCLISEPFADSLRSPCPDVSRRGMACVAGDATCVYYPEQAVADSPKVACVASCDVSGAGRVWAVECFAACNHACEGPSADSFAIELDTSDCAERPLMPCPDGALTLQGELDRMLHDALGPEAPVGEINESRLFVEFKDGCPARFYPGNSVHLSTLAEHVVERLNGVRWACATKLECAVLEGPSTLATP